MLSNGTPGKIVGRLNRCGFSPPFIAFPSQNFLARAVSPRTRAIVEGPKPALPPWRRSLGNSLPVFLLSLLVIAISALKAQVPDLPKIPIMPVTPISIASNTGCVNGVCDANSCSQTNPPLWCKGTDIFAWANAAATQSKHVLIPPSPVGCYTLAAINPTSLTCISSVEFDAAGVCVNVPASIVSSSNAPLKSAIVVKNSNACKIIGPMAILGTSTPTPDSVGMYFGDPNPESEAEQTQNNVVEDVQFGQSNPTTAYGFDVDIQLDGNTNSGTYYNSFKNVAAYDAIGAGWSWNPTNSIHLNNNECYSCRAIGNGGDGFLIQGAVNLTFVGVTSEANGQCGFNFSPSGVNTFLDLFLGGDSEENITADICFGGPSGSYAANVTHVTFDTVQLNSKTPIVGNQSANAIR